MGFWETIFVVGVALGVLAYVVSSRVPQRPVGVVLLLGGLAAFAVRAFQDGPYVAPKGFDLLAGVAALVLGGVLFRGRRGNPHALARLALALAPLLLIGAAISTIHEIGDIVTLRTVDAEGRVRETRLAVLDYDGATWIGAGAGEERLWYPELVANPRVELVRDGVTSCRIAQPEQDPAVREQVCRRLEQKYLSGRVAAALGSHLFLNPRAIAIRLDPCPEPGRGS